MAKHDGFWQRPSPAVLFVISILALGLSMAALLRPGPTGTVSAQQGAVSGEQKQILTALQDGFVSIAESVEPAVVSIEAITRPGARDTNPTPNEDESPFNFPDPFGFFRNPQPQPQPRGGTSTGSGVIVRVNGGTAYVLTNNHVVDGATNVKVILPGRDEIRVDAKVVGTDEKTDLAVLSIDSPRGINANNIPKFGDSSKVRVGQWAIAIGNPLGVGETLTVGVVSATGREVSGVEGFKDYRDMIQTDASINPGNSGGPLVNVNGEIIGINTAIASPSRGSIGIGFAIPSNVVRSITDQLISKGSVVRGYLGVQTTARNRRLNPEMREFYGVPYGALVELVSPDTPAAKAGLKPEDVIVAWNGEKIESFDELENAVQSTPPGLQVPLEVYRDGKKITLTITTARRPAEADLQGREDTGTVPGQPAPGQESKQAKLGITVTPLTADIAQRLQLERGTEGVLVTDVEFGGPADEAGLPRGAVITRVGRTRTPTVKAFQDAIAALKPGDAAILMVNVPGPNNTRTTTIISVKPTTP